MSRPNSISDLPAHERDVVTLVSVSSEVLDMHPTAAARIYAAFGQIMEEDYDFRVQVENGNLVRSKTDAELNRALESARRIWDQGKKEYEYFKAGGDWPKYDYAMRAYCRAEGIDFPEKPTE